MKKILRVSLMTLLAVFGMGNVMAQGVEINFDDNYATLFPTLPGVSQSANQNQGIEASNDGDFNEATTSTAVSGYTVTVSAKEEGANNANRIWGSSPRLRMYSGTFTVTGSGIKQIEFTASTNKFNLSTTTGTLTDKVWKGNANEVVFTVGGNTQLNKIVINGEDVTPEPVDPVTTTGSGTLADPYTAADAIAVASALASGANSDDVYVKGKVSTVKFPFDVDHGTATFFISDNGAAENEFQCYAVLYLENKAWVEGNTQIAVGDEVIIYGKLTNYQGNTPETVSRKAYIYSLNGQTQNEVQPEPVSFIGDGSKNNPYLVSDVRQMTEDIYPTEKVWVKGVIIGSASSKTALKPEGEDVVSNIAIAVSATATEFTPVELKSGSAFRTQLNLVDNPGNKGKEVLLYGQITNYFTTAGVKNLQEVVFEGQTITGINTIAIDSVNAPAYSLDGRRVDANYRGVVIKNGKKLIQK